MQIFTSAKNDTKEQRLSLSHVAPPPLRVDPIIALEGHTDRVWCVSWCPTAKVLASCSGDGTVRIWSCPQHTPTDDGSCVQWKCIQTLKGEHSRTVRHVAWSPSGEYIACASFDRTVSVWKRSADNSDCFEFDLEGVLDGHESEGKCVAWATDNTLATCSRDRTVWIWDRVDAGEYECAGVLTGHSQDVKSCVWILPSDNSAKAVLLSCSYDNTVKVWKESHRRDDWHCVQTLTKHEGTVWSASVQPIAFSIDALRADADESQLNTEPIVCCCSDDRSVSFWARDADGKFHNVATASGFAERAVYSVGWAPGDDAIVACGSGEDKLTLLGLHQSSEDHQVHVTVLAEIPGAHESDVNSVAFYPLKCSSENYPMLLATGGDDNVVRLWQVTRA